ncbi:non-muscle caldesmon-like isoform X5 [Gadus macrocephalus]|uniref:non-muscle caldesmon-like isoform X5 n=1 Tax=Gadus macrocephalus TaxID=80720 RepID=UPI0028CB3F97|nr:non-muscle caldesmon-like isoform X5 [Gadus macrocephalus]
MSSSIKRRHSNKQGLQNLIRVTAQRSQEDAEEVERERRRRSREQPREQCEHGDQGGRPTWAPSPNPPQDPTPPTAQYDEEVKPPQSRLVLEEDEGFSDWTQRLENRKESLLRQEHSRRSEESRFTHKQKLKHQEEEDKKGEGPETRGSITTPGTSRYSEEKICDRKKDIVISCSSSVLNLPQKARSLAPKVLPRNISSLESETTRPCSPTHRDLHLVDGEGAGAFKGLDEACQTHRDRGERVVGEMKCRTAEQPHDMADLHYSLDERCRLQDVELESHMTMQEEELGSEGGDQLTQTSHSNHGDTLETNPYGPMGPTFKKLLIRFYPKTEPLTCSLNKSMRRTLSPTADSKIDDYTHDFKDAEGLKVGVADLINQWVKASPDGTRSSSPTKPAEIKPGDVLCKKNLWENLGDSSSPGRGGKGSSPGKRYKFVVSGHGKYEKVAVDDNDCSEHDKYKSAGDYHEDL